MNETTAYAAPSIPLAGELLVWILASVLGNLCWPATSDWTVSANRGRARHVGVGAVAEDMVELPAEPSGPHGLFDHLTGGEDAWEGGEERQRRGVHVWRRVAVDGCIRSNRSRTPRAAEASIPAKFDSLDPGCHVLPGCAIDEDAGQVTLDLPSCLIIVETGDDDVVDPVFAPRYLSLVGAEILLMASSDEVRAAPPKQCLRFDDLRCAGERTLEGGVGHSIEVVGGEDVVIDKVESPRHKVAEGGDRLHESGSDAPDTDRGRGDVDIRERRGCMSQGIGEEREDTVPGR